MIKLIRTKKSLHNILNQIWMRRSSMKTNYDILFCKIALYGYYSMDWVLKALKLKKITNQSLCPPFFQIRLMHILICMIVKRELFLMLMQTRQHMKTETEWTVRQKSSKPNPLLKLSENKNTSNWFGQLERFPINGFLQCYCFWTFPWCKSLDEKTSLLKQKKSLTSEFMIQKVYSLHYLSILLRLGLYVLK